MPACQHASPLYDRTVQSLGHRARWGIGGYATLALACTAAWLLLGSQAAERNGLRRELFLVNGFVGQPFRQEVSDGISLDFLDDDERLPRQRFGVRWRGYWYVPDDGPLVIHGEGDDRLNVHVDGELVLRRYPPEEMHLATGTVALAAGVHELLIEYEQEGGAYALDVRWSPPSDRTRPFAGYRMFHERPSMEDVRLAERAAWLGWAVMLLWVAPLVTVAGVGARRAWLARDRYGPASRYAPHWNAVLRGGLALAGGAVVVRAVAARLPGLNPPSLWRDDLVYGAIIRSESFLDMVTSPIHVAPGPLVVWRLLYALLPDPEWSLQLLPFVCGIATIPLMALVAWRLTGNTAVALLAAAVTSLVQLLAHYTVFVHQYTLEAVITALFLLAATRLVRDGTEVDARRFRRVALAGGIATLFAVPVVFVTFPVVNLGALYAIRAWVERKEQLRHILLSAVGYNAMVVVAWWLLRNRSNPALRGEFADGFLPSDSLAAAWSFLVDQGGRLLMISLPGWTEGWSFNPGEMSWTLPFVGLGLVWLLARRETRFFGLAVLGFYAARVVASALWIYPLGLGRPDIFSFPVAICLFASGIHAATAALPHAHAARATVAAAVVVFALIRPVEVGYWDSNGASLVHHLAANAQADDPVMLSASSRHLTAFYGPWPVTTQPTDTNAQGVAVTVERDRTLFLPRSARDAEIATEFLRQFRSSGHVWYLARHTESERVVAAMTNAGYAAESVQATTDYGLFLGTR